MNRDAHILGSAAAAAVGRPCAIERLDYGWSISFDGAGDGLGMFVETLWRVAGPGRIGLTSEDDGQRFGREQPFDAERTVNALLSGDPVTAFTVKPATGDVEIVFDSGLRLEILTSSGTYESWNATFRWGRSSDADLRRRRPLLCQRTIGRTVIHCVRAAASCTGITLRAKNFACCACARGANQEHVQAAMRSHRSSTNEGGAINAR